MFYDQLTIKEMSAALNKSENTIKTYLYRALRKLRAKDAERDGRLERL